MVLTLLAAVPSTAADALKAAQIAQALTASFRSGQPVSFDANGEPILPKGFQQVL